MWSILKVVGTMSALILRTSNGELMAEIRVAPQRRNRAMTVMIVVALIVVAVVAWYFLAGPGAGA